MKIFVLNTLAFSLHRWSYSLHNNLQICRSFLYSAHLQIIYHYPLNFESSFHLFISRSSFRRSIMERSLLVARRKISPSFSTPDPRTCGCLRRSALSTILHAVRLLFTALHSFMNLFSVAPQVQQREIEHLHGGRAQIRDSIRHGLDEGLRLEGYRLRKWLHYLVFIVNIVLEMKNLLSFHLSLAYISRSLL